MIVEKIKLPANVVYEFTNFGYIKACTIFDSLVATGRFKKKNETVVNSLENLLCDGKAIAKAEYDALTNEIILYLESI